MKYETVITFYSQSKLKNLSSKEKAYLYAKDTIY